MNKEASLPLVLQTPVKVRQRGFSLIEIALVLVIVGIALGGIVSALGPQLENKKVSDTQKSLNEAREALMGWAIVNGRLPRPATSAVNGVEAAADCPNELACTGFIPWTTLGVSKLDSWGKVIRYSVTPAFATTGTNITAATAPTKTVRTRNAGVLADLDTNVPAVLYSHGRFNFGTTDTGGIIVNSAGPANADEITNNPVAPPAQTFIQRPPSEPGTPIGAGGEFDDIVIWVNRARLVNQLTSAGIITP
jgi:prepilin-type N-terminal cleavage/methylation domain-containing protein